MSFDRAKNILRSLGKQIARSGNIIDLEYENKLTMCPVCVLGKAVHRPSWRRLYVQCEVSSYAMCKIKFNSELGLE